MSVPVYLHYKIPLKILAMSELMDGSVGWSVDVGIV